ncbi:MAG: hypothetical protein HZB68_04400 [Candidatus Aenigmarchaeota archaeon]|nr:hypothetical protein [Candidatus Aenigmarchaeota archaeon]
METLDYALVVLGSVFLVAGFVLRGKNNRKIRQPEYKPGLIEGIKRRIRKIVKREK